MVARAIHFQGKRKEGPFIPVHCASIPENLLESELFGYEKGAFTGANRNKPGRFSLAEGGTLFLDEIGEMPFSLQSKLLRVLEEKEFVPVGGTRSKKVDVRIIAATLRNLEAMVSEGTFREDLYYRLNVIPIHIPPLRERRDDIPLLVDHFLRRYCEAAGKPLKTVSPEAFEILMRYDWPGNVRELENALERAIILQEGHVIKPEDLPERMRSTTPGSKASVITASNLTLDELEREYMLKVLEETGWHKKRAAAILGINTSTLYRKLQRYGCDKNLKEPVGSAK